MRHVLIIGGALAALTTNTYAADMPIAAPETYDWSGFYIGGQAGYGWADFEYEFNTTGHYNSVPGDALDASADGFIGGGHIGHNWQLDQMVAGLEISGYVGDLEDTDPSFFAGETVTNEVEWFLTVAPRFGYAFDNFLVYGKAGLAIGDVRSFMEDGTDYYEETNTQLGFTAGVGVEYGITENISVGVEYMYVNFGDENIAGESRALSDDSPWGSFTDSDLDTDIHTISGRISLRF